MTHLTIHSRAGATATLAWTPGGYDAVAWNEDTRAALIDNVGCARSLYQAAVWLAAQLDYGNEHDVGEVLGQLLCGLTVDDIGGGPLGDIAKLIVTLLELRNR